MIEKGTCILPHHQINDVDYDETKFRMSSQCV